MAGSVGKLGEQQPWLGMTASPSGAKENNQSTASRKPPRRRRDDDYDDYEEDEYDDDEYEEEEERMPRKVKATPPRKTPLARPVYQTDPGDRRPVGDLWRLPTRRSAAVLTAKSGSCRRRCTAAWSTRTGHAVQQEGDGQPVGRHAVSPCQPHDAPVRVYRAGQQHRDAAPPVRLPGWERRADPRPSRLPEQPSGED